MRAPPAMASAVRSAGISAMSFAGNHCLDYGYIALQDTIEHAAAAGIRLFGAGMNLETARAPVIVTVAGLRIALLAANAILPEGYAADAHTPGCAPLRAHTVYEQIEHDQPGTPARTRTFAHRTDLTALIDSVRSARDQADQVLVSLHWGIHMVPVTLADYQIEVAHAVIDAGAQAVIGHHPHVLKGIEIYRGCPIFYSLGNFAIEQPHIWDPEIVRSASFSHLVSLNPSWTLERTYMLPPITRLTGIAKLVLAPPHPMQVRFVPAWIGDDSAPQLLQTSDGRFAEVQALLERSSNELGFDTRFSIDGSELLLHGAS